MKLWLLLFIGVVAAWFPLRKPDKRPKKLAPTDFAMECASPTDYCRVGESPTMCECCGIHIMSCVLRNFTGLERWYPDDPILNGWYLRAKPCPMAEDRWTSSCFDGACNPDIVSS